MRILKDLLAMYGVRVFKSVGVAILFLALGGHCLPANAQYTASSLAELRALSNVSNATVTMAPGEYWISGSVSNGTVSNASYIDLTGNNTVYDFSAAQFKLDTRDLYGHGSSTGDFNVMNIGGANLTVNGLNLTGVGVALDTDPNARRWGYRASNYLRIQGNNTALNNAHIVTAGSNPYGYGDAFGKGAPPAGRDLPPGEGGVAYLGHNKTSGILINNGADSVKIDGLDLDMFTFGHGVYIQQGGSNVEIRNTAVTGQLFNSNNVINHPAYQEYGVNVYGQVMFPDIMISGSEDGIRYYGDENGNPSQNLIIDNVVVTNMREAFSLMAVEGNVTVNNASAYGNETGFEPGPGTVITNSRGDVTNGPLLYYRRNNVDNTNIEIELVGDVPQAGRTWDVAYINGENNVVTLTSDIDPNLLSDQSYVRVGQRFNDWRHNMGDLDNTSLPANGLVLNNLTGQITVLGTNGDAVSGFSSAGTVNGGDGNQYDGLTLVLNGTRMIAKDSMAMGNNGTAADGSLESNASIVFGGATLELNPGVNITNEKLTITGNGVDGKGALYTNGQTGSGTRFGSSQGNESTIFLAGDASIGVGIAGNQLLVGSIQGTGNLTKLGAGKLSMEKSNTFVGNLIVAEGHITGRTGMVQNHNGLTVAEGASISGISDNAFNTQGDVNLYGEMDLNSRTSGGLLTGKIGRLFGSGNVKSSYSAGGSLGIAFDSGVGDFSGQISDNVSLTKSGTGTQILSGNNTYSGTTTIDGGLLQIDGMHTGGGAYTINDGGMLGGKGMIDSAILISDGGHLSPGASAGTLTVGALTFEAGSFFDVELGGATVGTEYDLLLADSAMLGGTLIVSLLDSGGIFQPSETDIFTILTSGMSLAGEFENVASGERLATLAREGTFLVTYGINSSSPNSVTLSNFAVAVPEPNSAAFFTILSVSLMFRRRKR